MYKILSFVLLFSFCFSQDSTSVEQKLGEVAQMRIDKQFDALKDLRLEVQNTIISAKSQIEISEDDLEKIAYAEFILRKLLDHLETD